MKIKQIDTDFGIVPIRPSVEQNLIDENLLYKRLNELWEVGLKVAWIDGKPIFHQEYYDNGKPIPNKFRIYLNLHFEGTQYLEITENWEKNNE